MREGVRATDRATTTGEGVRRRGGSGPGRSGPPPRKDPRRPRTTPTTAAPPTTPPTPPAPHNTTITSGTPASHGVAARPTTTPPTTPTPLTVTRAAAVSRSAAAAAACRQRDRLPRYWFANRLVLTLSGQRPVHTLLGHALPAAYDRLIELAPHAPLRPAAGRATAPVVRRCGEYQPRHGVIEAFARIASGDRLSALAFRLELGADARWRCAAIDLGPLAQMVPDGS
ncbi:Rv3235 family protein [Streptomyces niphimycinicus]|uniref:Rv3235 family protein n=1 Tax=Streptomyces niphimycinicus TaxID=2842201 RepID=UPI00209B3D73|nr:Rv3235 family protein [Streptomyces niphimycinicus]